LTSGIARGRLALRIRRPSRPRRTPPAPEGHRTPSARSLAALAVALIVGVACAEPHAERPDVVLVTIDSLRADHLDHLGYDRPTATDLDLLRDRSTLFARALAPTPSTAPSTASLLTGRFPLRHGILTPDGAIADDVATLAEVLRESGWSTAAVSHHPVLTRERGFARGFERFEGAIGPATRYADADQMVAWMREWLAEARRPFFLYLHVMNVHGPYRVPTLRRQDLLGHLPGTQFSYGDTLMRGIMEDGAVGLRGLVTARYLGSLVDQYDTAVRYATGRVAKVLDLLRADGGFDESIVVLTADHGEELFDHGGFGHGHTLYREVLHVPLYVKTPGQQTGRTVDSAVSLMDVFPTILELLSLPAPDVDGRSLVPALRGESDALEARVFHHVTAWEEASLARGVLDGRYKLIDAERSYDAADRRRLLFDLVVDPGETRDLSGTGSEIVERLSGELDDAFGDGGIRPRSAGDAAS
jgi:arylsulfatase A-like enzyme